MFLTYQNDWCRLYRGGTLAVTAALPNDSVDLIVADPPYFKVKKESWDRQWDKPAAFLDWVRQLCGEWSRVLRPNGSLYVFASPRMAWHVEGVVRERFDVVSNVRWVKDAGWSKKQHKEEMRGWWPASETILFAEHPGADGIAKGEAGYGAKCDELRGFVFEPIRAYLDGERKRAGASKPQVDAAWCRFKGVQQTAQSQKWFSSSCWNLPTPEAYEWLRSTLASLNGGGEYLRRQYEDLRRQYEDLRRQYEDLRRPFTVSADVPYTDVWTFPTVTHYRGKHPCEKPLPMLEHIVRASSRPEATVFDPMMGSGVTGEACRNLGRKFIGCERDPTYFAGAVERIKVTDRPEAQRRSRP